jgi:hypothetical protein
MGQEQVGGVTSSKGMAETLLDRLLAPVTRATFLAEYHEKAPLCASSGEPHRFASLLTLEAVDAFMASADLRHDMLRLVARGDLVEPARYVGPDGRVLPGAVAQSYLRGATIILPQLDLSFASVAEHCRALEVDLSAAVQANAYLTPASAQGFDPHYDQHDVFILQIAGSKRWRLYDRSADAAAGAPFVRGASVPGPLSAEHVLSAGDCLYIPRGMVHEATNEGSEPSLHLTLGVHARSWGDLVLQAVAALVRTDAAFQRALPPGFATQAQARRAAEDKFAELLGRLGSEPRLDKALDDLAREFLQRQRPNIAGLLAAPRPSGRLRARPLLQWWIGEEAGDVILTGPGGDLRFARSDEAAVREALSGQPFDPARLPCPDPARMTERLWANGYLEPVENPR